MSRIIPLLQNVPLFQDLSVSELESIAPLFVEKKYKKGTVLFIEEDEGDELFLVESGTVKVYRIDQTKEIILALFREGDFFGEMSLIQKGQTRSATAETIETTVIHSLVRSDFQQFMERTPKLCLRLLETTIERLRKTNEQIYDLTFLDVRSRTIKQIVRLSEQYGVAKPAGTFINLKLTHQQLANLVGTVRESVTKVLQELQDLEMISVEKKIILVKDLEALKRLIH